MISTETSDKEFLVSGWLIFQFKIVFCVEAELAVWPITKLMLLMGQLFYNKSFTRALCSVSVFTSTKNKQRQETQNKMLLASNKLGVESNGAGDVPYTTPVCKIRSFQ